MMACYAEIIGARPAGVLRFAHPPALFADRAAVHPPELTRQKLSYVHIPLSPDYVSAPNWRCQLDFAPNLKFMDNVRRGRMNDPILGCRCFCGGDCMLVD
jgi:hypothetical protein